VPNAIPFIRSDTIHDKCSNKIILDSSIFQKNEKYGKNIYGKMNKIKLGEVHKNILLREKCQIRLRKIKKKMVIKKGKE